MAAGAYRLGVAKAAAWPGPLAHGLVTRLAGKAGGWSKETTNLSWDAAVPWVHDCGNTHGDSTTVRDEEAAVTFQNCLFLSRDLLVVDICNVSVTGSDKHKSHRAKPPWFGRCMQGRLSKHSEAQPVQGAFQQAPLVGQPFGSLRCWCLSIATDTTGWSTAGQLTLSSRTAYAPQVTPKFIWSHPLALPGQAPGDSWAEGASSTGNPQNELSKPLNKHISPGRSPLLNSSHPSVPGT